MPNASGFVSSRDEGERFVAMLGGRAKLDYRPNQPNHIQVKIGATEENVGVLQRLCNASYAMRGWMTPELVKWALDPGKHPGFEPPLARKLRLVEGERDAAVRAIGSIRDSVLHGRHQLADYEVDCDVTNAVLGIIDDESAALAKTDSGAT